MQNSEYREEFAAIDLAQLRARRFTKQIGGEVEEPGVQEDDNDDWQQEEGEHVCPVPGEGGHACGARFRTFAGLVTHAVKSHGKNSSCADSLLQTNV